MKTLFLICLAGLVVTVKSSAQMAVELNSGLRLTAGTAQNSFTLSWWGVAGRTYFIQTSETLMEADWRTVPVIESGTGAVISWGFTTTGERGFMRLIHTDVAYTGAVQDADFDGDGLSNGLETSIRTNPLLADGDGDGFNDGEEYQNGTNVFNDASNGALGGEESGLTEQPVSVFGFIKSVNNSWYSPPSSSAVSWADSTPAFGSVSYTGFSSQLDSRLGTLTYPMEIAKLSESSWSGVIGSAWKTQGSEAGYGHVYHIKACVATAVRGVTQPWCVSRNFLHFVSSRDALGTGPALYETPFLHQFTIRPHQEVSNFTFLEPGITDQSGVEHGLLYPEVWGYVTLDKESTAGGRHEQLGSDADGPPVLEKEAE